MGRRLRMAVVAGAMALAVTVVATPTASAAGGDDPPDVPCAWMCCVFACAPPVD